MRLSAWVAGTVLSAAFLCAQHQKLTINSETPEGKILQEIGQESDGAKKIALMEQFIEKNPKHEGAAWVYAQMIPAYTAAGQFDKALDAGDKLLALDPEDVESAHAALKAAEAKKDPDQVIKWAGRTSAVARKVAQTPKPSDADAVEEWTRTVDYAKQVDVYTEYSMYALALQLPDAQKKLALGDALEKQNPQSQYLPQMAGQRFQAYVQTGNMAKAIAVAEKAIETDQTNEDMLLAVADHYRASKQNPEKVFALSHKAIQVAESKAKPAGVSDADWATRKTQVLGRAHWIAGVTYAGQSRWAETDRELRAALTGIKDNQPLLAEALFYLGLANYRMGEKGQPERISDAVRFNEQCAAIRSPFQAQAQKNLKVIRAQYRNVK